MPVYNLVEDREKYKGKFVATRGLVENKVICHGKDPREVRKKAIENGVEDPIVFYVDEAEGYA